MSEQDDTELDKFLEDWVMLGVRPIAKAKIKALLVKARVEAVQELKRRWHEDRKTMDYSPDTYDFICDKYLKELQVEQGEEDNGTD